jgi:hypothetical protein
VGLGRSRIERSALYVRGVGSLGLRFGLCAGNASQLRGRLIGLGKANFSCQFCPSCTPHLTNSGLPRDLHTLRMRHNVASKVYLEKKYTDESEYATLAAELNACL